MFLRGYAAAPGRRFRSGADGLIPALTIAARTDAARDPAPRPRECAISPSATAPARCCPKLSPRHPGRGSAGSRASATPAAIRAAKTEVSSPITGPPPRQPSTAEATVAAASAWASPR